MSGNGRDHAETDGDVGGCPQHQRSARDAAGKKLILGQLDFIEAAGFGGRRGTLDMLRRDSAAEDKANRMFSCHVSLPLSSKRVENGFWRDRDVIDRGADGVRNCICDHRRHRYD